MIYLAIAVALTILSYYYDYCRKERGKITWVIIMLLVFILVAGLRYRLGNDTIVYIEDYEKLNPINRLKSSDFEISRFGPGFIILSSFFRMLTDEFTFFQLFHATIVCSVVFYFLYKNCSNFFLALNIFFFFLYFLLLFQQMRESLAVSIFLLAWPAFRANKWWLWYLAAIGALMFHISSVVMLILPLFTLPGIRQLFVFGARTWMICLAVLIVGVAIQAMFFKYIELLALTESMAERAETYSKSAKGGAALNALGIVSFCVQYVLFPAIALYFSQKNRILSNEKKNRFDKLEFMTMMSIYVSLLSISISIISRYNNYFFPFAIVMMGNFAYSKLPMMGKFIRLKFAYWVLLFCPMFAMLTMSYFSNYNKSGTLKGYMVYYPYSSYFDQTIDKNREACFRYAKRFNR